jgi:hypothetical protein
MTTTTTDLIPFIITVGEPGSAVVFGWADALPSPDQPCVLYSARMILYWAGSAGLFGLATNGPAEGSRLSCAVAETRCVARQVLSVTPAAATALEGWPDAT